MTSHPQPRKIKILGTDRTTGQVPAIADGIELRAVSGMIAAISCQLSGHFPHLYHLSTSTFFFKLCLHIKLGLVSVASYLVEIPWLRW